MARALSVGLEVTNSGLDPSPASDGGFVLYGDNNLELDPSPASNGGLMLYDDNNPALDAPPSSDGEFVTCARTHTLPH